MDAIDDLFETAVRDGRIHGVSVLARDVKGGVHINRSYGVRSVNAPEGQRPAMQDDTPMRFASATKFLTSIMALQCVERGEVRLDDTLDELLPEVARLNVITGYEEETGNTIERPPNTPITLRHLLSHSSGVAYAVLSPLLVRFRTDQGREVDQVYDTLDENFSFPLIYDPGTDWTYGPGLDWCTRLIARASGQPAEDYLQSHLVKPLNICPEEMTFNLHEYPEAHARHADVVLRTEGSPSHFVHDGAMTYWDRVKEPSGGQGIFCSTRAYMEVMYSILADDGRVLKPETRKLLFEPALTPDSQRGLSNCFVKLRAAHIGEPVPAETPKSHSVGGLLAMGDCDPDDPESWRRKGSLSWAGVTNIFWNIDPAAGLCCLWAFHLKPFGDEICVKLGTEFERAVYNLAREK